MPNQPALPFTIRRQHDVIGRGEFTSTTETVHGLLRLDGDQLHIQWRIHRATDRIGEEIRQDQETEATQEVVVPVARLAGAALRRPWWAVGRPWQLVLTAADLGAFEPLAGPSGLQLLHPAQFVFRVERRDHAAAQEFVADVELAVSEQAMRLAAGTSGSADPRFPPNQQCDPPPTPTSNRSIPS